MTGYGLLLFLHSAVRWAVLLGGVAALAAAGHGWARSRAFTKTDERVQRAFVGFADLQFLAGLALYFFYSPIVDAFWDAPRVAVKEHTLRFFGIEHITTMVVAIAVLHIGRTRARKAPTDRVRHRRLALSAFFCLALVASAIPWPGLRHGRPLARGLGVPAEALVAVAPEVGACPSVYAERCAACHGVQGGGDGVAAPALRPRPRTFRARGWDAGKSDDALVAVIRDGGARHGLSAAMPSNADLPDAELAALARCVRGFQAR